MNGSEYTVSKNPEIILALLLLRVKLRVEPCPLSGLCCALSANKLMQG